MQIIVRMIPLPCQVFAFLGDASFLLLAVFLRSDILLAGLAQHIVLFSFEIRELFNLGLVQPVDNRVLTLGDMNALDLRS